MKKKYYLTALSAILSSLPFTFPSLFLLTVFSPSLFFYFLYKTNGFKAVLKLSFLWASLYYLGVHYYFISLYPLDFAGLSNAASIGVVIVGWIGISLFQGIELALFLCLFKRLSVKSGKLTPVLLACVFALCEYVQSLGWLGFPWGQIALTQYKFLPFIQSLSLFGPYFLSFVIVMISAMLAYFYIHKNKLHLWCVAAVFLLNIVYGIVCMNISPVTLETVDVAVIQPSITTDEKWVGGKRKSSFDYHMELSKRAAGADIIVWSETAIIREVLNDRRYTDTLRSFSRENNTSFIIGTFHSDKDRNTYNAAVYVDSDAESAYFKQHLVPFGEYVPWRPFFEICLPFLTDINMLSSDLANGRESNPLDTRFGKIGALVCFDSIFTDLARKSVKNGAQMLTVITNDSWYKDSTALYHHNAQSVFRAVENRRWVARCANTGVSSFIDECGRIVYMSDPYEISAHTEPVELIESKTLYTTMGNVFVFFAFTFVFCIALKKKVPH